MSDLINGRTPEEIKAGLKACTTAKVPGYGCNIPCPYLNTPNCWLPVKSDALALIERLESERDAAMVQSNLISRSAVLETINEVDISDCTDIDDIIDRIYAEAASVPTINAVPVVRCKDCKYIGTMRNYQGGIDLFCDLTDYYTKPDGFCDCGER